MVRLGGTSITRLTRRCCKLARETLRANRLRRREPPRELTSGCSVAVSRLSPPPAARVITYADGANGIGSVFELSTSGGGWSYRDLNDFTGGNDGKLPTGSVAFDANGNLFGTTSEGGI